MAKVPKDFMTSPASIKGSECYPPAGTKTNGAVGYDVPTRTPSKNAVPEVTYDHNSPSKGETL